MVQVVDCVFVHRCMLVCQRTHALARPRREAALVVYPPSEFSRLGETQCMLYTNLAAVHVQEPRVLEPRA